MKKIKYEKPVLYGLDHRSQDAEGMGCGGGSAFNGANCQSGGPAGNMCQGGTWAGAPCIGVGNGPNDFYSVCGIGSGNTHGCGTGSSAAGGCFVTGTST